LDTILSIDCSDSDFFDTLEGMRNTTRHVRACPQAVLGSLRSRHFVVECDIARVESHPGVV
jgi:hypothetical protein